MRGFDDNEISQMILEAKSAVHWPLRRLTSLFDEQIQRLRERGCPERIIEILKRQRGAVVTKAGKIIFKDNHIPFLPIIPFDVLSPRTQMPMVRSQWKEGRKHTEYRGSCLSDQLDPRRARDLIETPKSPYYIFDVCSGLGAKKDYPGNLKEVISKQGRSGFVSAELVAMGIHSDIFIGVNQCGWHDILALETEYRWNKYDKDAEVMQIGLYGAMPTFQHCSLWDFHEVDIAPSCASRGV